MARKLPNPPRRGLGGSCGWYRIPPLLDCKPFRGPKLTEDGKPFEPTDREIGAELTFSYDGRDITGQVWSLAVGGVWVVADGTAYLLGKEDWVREVLYERKPAEDFPVLRELLDLNG
jgi:hypothetical protein